MTEPSQGDANEDEVEDEIEKDVLGEVEQKQYDEKLAEMRGYLPTLQTLMQRCTKDETGDCDGLLKKLNVLHKMFSNRKRKLTFKTLIHCEKVLKGLARKIRHPVRRLTCGSPPAQTAEVQENSASEDKQKSKTKTSQSKSTTVKTEVIPKHTPLPLPTVPSTEVTNTSTGPEKKTKGIEKELPSTSQTRKPLKRMGVLKASTKMKSTSKKTLDDSLSDFSDLDELLQVETTPQHYSRTKFPDGRIKTQFRGKMGFEETLTRIDQCRRQERYESRPTFRHTRPGFRPTRPVFRPTRPDFRPTRPDFGPTRPDFRPTMPDFRPTMQDLRPTRPDFRPTRPDFRPTMPDFRPTRPDFRPTMQELRPTRAEFRSFRANSKQYSPFGTEYRSDFKPMRQDYRPDFQPSKPDFRQDFRQPMADYMPEYRPLGEGYRPDYSSVEPDYNSDYELELRPPRPDFDRPYSPSSCSWNPERPSTNSRENSEVDIVISKEVKKESLLDDARTESRKFHSLEDRGSEKKLKNKNKDKDRRSLSCTSIVKRKSSISSEEKDLNKKESSSKLKNEEKNRNKKESSSKLKNEEKESKSLIKKISKAKEIKPSNKHNKNKEEDCYSSPKAYSKTSTKHRRSASLEEDRLLRIETHSKSKHKDTDNIFCSKTSPAPISEGKHKIPKTLEEDKSKNKVESSKPKLKEVGSGLMNPSQPFSIGNSFSTDLNIEDFQDSGEQKDFDKLQSSRRNLEVLMSNRIASMNASKLSTSTNTPKVASIPDPVSETISSTLDELMSNLNSKFRFNRRQPKEVKPVSEVESKSNRVLTKVTDSDKAEIQELVSKMLLENKAILPSVDRKTSETSNELNKEESNSDRVLTESKTTSPLPKPNNRNISGALIDVWDNTDLHQRVSKFLSEIKISSSLPKPVSPPPVCSLSEIKISSSLPKPVSPPPVCSLLTGSDKSVPFLRDDDDSVVNESFLWKDTAGKQDTSSIAKEHASDQSPKERPNITVDLTIPSAKPSTVSEPQFPLEDQNKGLNSQREILVCQTKEQPSLAKDSEIMTATAINSKVCQNLQKQVPNTVESVNPKITPQNPGRIKGSLLSLPLPMEGRFDSDDDSSNDKSENVWSTPKRLDTENKKASESQVFPQRGSDELVKAEKPSQSLREKLSQEISAIHKVGSSYGGALRGLISRDKDKLPPARIASLKPGTLIDLYQEDKPQRSITKPKSKPQLQPGDTSSLLSFTKSAKNVITNDNTDMNCPSIQANPVGDILSKLSETDLKKIVSENIGELTAPPNLPFFSIVPPNVYSQDLTSQASPGPLMQWNRSGNSMQQISLHAHNVVINNINITPTEYRNTINNTLTHHQSPSNAGWPPNQSNDLWRSSVSSNDPRSNRFNNLTEVQHQQFDSHSSSSTSTNVYSERETATEPFPAANYNPPVLQTDPFKSPCYDGSSTPDPYRPDPYTLNLQENLETERNYSLLNSTSRMNQIPPHLASPPVSYEREVSKRSSLLVSPPDLYERDMSQRPSLLGTSPVQTERETFRTYTENSEFRSVDSRYGRTESYSPWRSEKNITDPRKTNDWPYRGFDDHRNYQNPFKWARDFANADKYDPRNRDYGSRYSKDNVPPAVTASREPDSVRKLAARDPRRRSIEETERKEGVDIQSRSVRRDPRMREKVPPRDRGRSRDRSRETVYRHDRSSSRGRVRSPSQDKSPYRRTEECKSSRYDKRDKGSYSSPLDSLYSNSAMPKTGLGYGIQKFRIPKINKATNDTRSEKKMKESKTSEKSESKDVQPEENEAKSNLNDEKSHNLQETAIVDTSLERQIGDNTMDEELFCNDETDKNTKDDGKEGETETESEETITNIKADKSPVRRTTRSSKKLDEDKPKPEEGEKKECQPRRSKRLNDSTKAEQSVIMAESKNVSLTENKCEDVTVYSKVEKLDNKGPEIPSSDISSIDLLNETKPALDEQKNLKNADGPTAEGSPQLDTNATSELIEKEHPSTCQQIISTKTTEKHSSCLTGSVLESSEAGESFQNDETKHVPSSCEEESFDKSQDKPQPEHSIVGEHNILGSLSEGEYAIDLSVKKSGENEPAIPLQKISQARKAIHNPPTIISPTTKPLDIGIDKVLTKPQSGDAKNETEIKTTPELFQKLFGVPYSAEKLKMVTEMISEKSNLNISSIVAVSNETKEEDQCVQISSTDQNSGESISDVETINNVNINKIIQTDNVKVIPSKDIQDSSIDNYEDHLTLEKEQSTKVEQGDCGKQRGESILDVKTINNDNIDKNIKTDLEICVGSIGNYEDHSALEKGNPTKTVKGKYCKKKKKPNVSKTQTAQEVTTSLNVTKKQKRKYKNELDRLQDDISKYHDSEQIAAASGLRLCRLQKEKPTSSVLSTPSNSQTQLNNIETQLTDKKKSIKKTGDFKEFVEIKEVSFSNDDSDFDSSDSDSMFLLSERLKSKYQPCILESEERLKRQQLLKEEECKTKTDTKESLCSYKIIEKSKLKSESIENLATDDNNVSTINTKSIKETSDSTLKKSAQIKIKKVEKEDGIVTKNDLITRDLEAISEQVICSEEKKDNNDSDSEKSPKKSISSNILHKYGIKKQKKKCFWKAGIIKKKTKHKKIENHEKTHFLEVEEPLELDTATDADYNDDMEDIVPEPPDISYFQEGDLKVIKCKLCSFSGKTIVSHYTITHPKDEVLISRMSPQAAEEAIKESRYFFSSNEDQIEEVLPYKCRICYVEFTKFSVFFEHMALHTGEFRHECCKCGYRTSTRSGIIKHYSTHPVKNPSATRCRILYKEPVNKQFFSGFLCSLCNFFQISQSNVKRHIENTHDIDDGRGIIKINFSKLNYSDEVMNINYDSEKMGDKNKQSQNLVTNISGTECPSQNSQEKITQESLPSVSYKVVEPHSNQTEPSKDTNEEEIDTSSDKRRTDGSEDKPLTLKSDTLDVICFDHEDLLKSTSDVSVLDRETGGEVEPGCFELSPDLDNHVHFIEDQISSEYKKRCEEAVAAISRRKNENYNSEIIRKLELKQIQSLVKPVNNWILEDLIGNKQKVTVVSFLPESNKPAEENVETIDEDSQPTRRLLPDRSCKGLMKSKSNDSDSDQNSEEECIIELFENLDEPRFGEDEDQLADLGHMPMISNVNRCPPMLFDKLVERCKTVVDAKLDYKPKSVNYISSLPRNSNLSEFTHVMQQISQYHLKPKALGEITVGGLKVSVGQNGTDTVFTCSVKVFNKDCEFQTLSLETFGHHVNMSHHLSYWDGSCGACFSVFLQDISSHDKAYINTQNKAFCHLVTVHFKFMNKSEESGYLLLNKGKLEPELGAGEDVTVVSASPSSRPLLRVRRLSGDKLSNPAPGTENSLVQAQKGVELPAVDNVISDAVQPPEIRKTITPAHIDESSVIARKTTDSTLLSVLDILNINAKDKKKGPTYSALKSATTLKTPLSYKAMCLHSKLRHFYKCMGARCSFTSNSFKAFAQHYEQHQDISSVSPADDPHKCHWNVCAYCLTTHTSNKELVVHLRKEHGDCTYQCGHCFYRAKSIANVHFHHTIDHGDEEFCVLECMPTVMNLPPSQEAPFTDFVTPLRCIEEGCVLFTYMFETFCQHLLTSHNEKAMCHVCSQRQSSVNALLEHFREEHGIGLYQCLYCVFGATTEHQIRLHLCYKHSNSIPKAIHRSDSSKSSEVSNRESLRRIVYNKDRDKLMQFLIPIPRGEIDQETISAAIRSTEPGRLHKPLEDDGHPVVIKHPMPVTISPTTLARQNANKRSTDGFKALKTPQEVYVVNSDGSKVASGVKVVGVRLPPRQSINQNFIKIAPAVPKPVVRPPSLIPISHLINTPGVPLITSVSGPIIPLSSITIQTLPTLSTPTSVVAASPLLTAASTSAMVTPSTKPTLSNEITPEITATFTSSSPQISQEQTTAMEFVYENYFKCGNRGCKFESSTSAPLRSHMVICDNGRKSLRLMCKHCNRPFKQAVSLIDHLRTHSPLRYSCSLCSFEGPMASYVISHMKSHSVVKTEVIPVNSHKQDPEKDLFVVTPKIASGSVVENNSEARESSGSSAYTSSIEQDGPDKTFDSTDRRRSRPKNPVTKEKRGRGYEKTKAKGGKGRGDKNKYSPNELDEIPKAAIFQHPLGCSLCPYETKVRSNLLRHMTQHTTGDIVSQEEVVNPVPNKTEKMFDKMMNLAGSSHNKKKGKMGEENDEVESEESCPYKYVPEPLRYKCHLRECGYQTHSETMLRDHVCVIHKEETYYACPHCAEADAESGTGVGRELVPIDQLGLHLKLHDSPLFKCRYCEHYSHIRRSIERHQGIIHRNEVVSVRVVRLNKPDQTSEPITKPIATGPPNERDDWLACNLCSFRTKTKKMMTIHGVVEHKMSKRFKCSVCNYESATDVIFNTHFKTYHPGDKSCHMISLYKKITELKRQSMVSIPPLWKRDAKKIKLIRGIKLDEKGDAPPPVATCVNRDVKDLDILELKFGRFGKPRAIGVFVCPRCPTFQVKNKLEMRDHLFKDMDYKPLTCIICKESGLNKNKISKHIHKAHNVELDRVPEFIESNINKDMEDWVEKVMSTQLEAMKELTEENASPVGMSKKRRRSTSADVSISLEDHSKMEEARTIPQNVTPEPSPSTSADSRNTSVSLIPTTTAANKIYTFQPDNDDSTIQSTIPTPSDDDDSDYHPTKKKKKRRDKCPSHHRFSCGYCNVTTKYRNSIVIHTKKVHPNMPPSIQPVVKPISEKIESFNCMYCNCTALDISNLKHHWLHSHKADGNSFIHRKSYVHSELEYKCFWCPKVNTLDSLKEHCLLQHANNRFLVICITVPKYKCSECRLVFNSVDILKRHFSMDHPTQAFCYTVVPTQSKKQVPLDSGDTPQPSNRDTRASEKPNQPKRNTFKCFSCHFVSSTFLPMAKHIQRHFVTYVCTECDSLFCSSFSIRSHMNTEHPGSQLKPLVLKGSDKDIENAKRNIILVSEGGKKRKITEAEIAEAEGEISFDQQCSEEGSLSPLRLSPVVRETARKSTSSPRQRVALQHSPDRSSRSLSQVHKTKLSFDNVFVTFKSHNKNIKLPVEALQKLVNFDSKLSIENDSFPLT